MESDDLIRNLLDADVLSPGDGPDELVVADGFRDDVASKTERLSDGGALPRELLQAGRESMPTDSPADMAVLGRYWALWDRLGDVPVEQLVRLVFVLDVVEFPPSQPAAKTGFLSISGDRLSPLFPLLRRAVVYVWRERCEPCDLLERDLATLRPTYGDEVLFLSVYGPSYQDVLREAFDVAVAPTTLLVRDGAVDTRFVGAVEPAALRSEFERSFGHSDASA